MSFVKRFCFSWRFLLALLITCFAFTDQAVGAEISGRTVDEEGKPLEGICVNALSLHCEQWINGGITDKTGSYQIEVPEGTYIVNTDVRCGSSATKTFLTDVTWSERGSVSDCLEGDSVTVSEETPAANIDLVLQYGGVVHGRIIDSNGEPVKGICVNALDAACDKWMGGSLTDTNGIYDITITGGDYTITTDITCGGNNEPSYLINMFWNGGGGTYSCSDASLVTVTKEHETNLSDLVLPYGGSVAGTLFHEDGLTPITCAHNLGVTIFRGRCEDLEWVGWAPVNPDDGTYHSPGLSPGTYYLQTYSDTSAIDEWWAEPHSTEICEDAQGVTIIAGTTIYGKDFQLDVPENLDTLYDGFSLPSIDISKWYDLEKIRGIKDGRLISGIRGAPEPDGFRNELPFANPSTISAIETEIIYLGGGTQAPGNIVPGAIVGGYFYESSNGPVYAHIGIGYGGSGIKAGIRVMDAGQLFDKKYFPIEIIKLHPYILKISYSQSDNQFVFSLTDKMTGHEELLYSDVPANMGPATKSFKGLTTTIWGNEGSGIGSIYMAFDNVRINNEKDYYDQFESELIDPAKWSKLDRARYIKNNKLVMSRHMKGGTRYTVSRIPESYTEGASYFGADIEITSALAIGNASATTFLIGAFYNDKFSEPNGSEGNTLGGIGLIYDLDGGYRLGYKTLRCDNADCSEKTQHRYQFMTSFEPGQKYHLSIEFRGDNLVFRCNNEVHEISVSEPVHPPSYRGWRVGVKADAPDNDEAYMRATFDNIVITKPSFCPYHWDLDKDGDVDGVDIVMATRDPYGINHETVKELAAAFGITMSE